MTLLDDFRRVSKSSPCPVCGRPDWCLTAREGDAAICQREESPRRIGEAGWLHGAEPARLRPCEREYSLAPAHGRSDIEALAVSYQRALGIEHLQMLSRDLGVSESALVRLGAGLADHREMEALGLHWARYAYSFPMRSGSWQTTGIRLRLSNGKKLSVKGGREGLFVPCGLEPDPDRLFLVEGPSDTAALLGLGLDALGRPSARGGVRHLRRLLRAVRPGEVVIVADADDAGRSGACDLAGRLRGYCRALRIVEPPAGHNDVRDWVRAGGTRADVISIVQDTSPLRARFVTEVVR